LVVLSHGRVALECATATADIASIGRAMAGDGAHEPGDAAPALAA
jgi:hypothetical protein